MRYSRRKSKRHQLKKIFYKINEQITSPQVKLIDNNNNFLGIVNTFEAIKMAKEKELSLIEISPKETPPTAKIMDYGKLQYQKQKQAKKQNARQKKAETKGIKLSLRIGKHDINFRKDQAKKFLNDNNKVKIELNLRGREKQHKEIAIDIIKNFIKKIEEETTGQNLVIEEPIKYKGNGFLTIINYKQ
ncbi:MAG: translation initiation factor IF-3 [Xanthomonadaceae bacterium]|nr:translation initiation factor IF-3 [Rhodospirillaceae bacterium]NIA17906.1 translation initiation factor IF-3 [Xanthomonadaceae bacterium]